MPYKLVKGGSKGIPRKNIVPILGKPLIWHSIKRSLESKFINETIVSTEDEEIAKISWMYGAKVFPRPKELAQDETPTPPVILHVLSKLNTKSDYVVILEPTSPFRRKNDLDDAIRKIVDEDGDSLVSVAEHYAIMWTRDGKPFNFTLEKRERRQDKKWEYAENGAIYIVKTDVFMKLKYFPCGDKILFYEMPPKLAIDIDTPFDLKMAETLMASGSWE